MKRLGLVVSAALVVAPMLLVAASAEAATARQYQAQGHGRYLSSKGRPLQGYGAHRYGQTRYFGRHHRGYR